MLTVFLHRFKKNLDGGFKTNSALALPAPILNTVITTVQTCSHVVTALLEDDMRLKFLQGTEKR